MTMLPTQSELPSGCARIAAPMKKVGDFLGNALRGVKRPEAALAWLTASWSRLVGEKLAAHTRPVAYSSGILEVAADAREWKNQLDQMKKEFCDRINCAWGGNLVREVRFVLGTARRLPHEADNDHTPFIRRGRK